MSHAQEAEPSELFIGTLPYSVQQQSFKPNYNIQEQTNQHDCLHQQSFKPNYKIHQQSNQHDLRQRQGFKPNYNRHDRLQLYKNCVRQQQLNYIY